MKTYKFDNATIYVEGEVNEECLKKATIRFFRSIHKSKMNKEGKALCQR